MFSGSDGYRLRYDNEVPAPSEKTVAAFVRERLLEEFPLKPEERKRAQPGEWTYQGIADALGVTKPQVHALVNDCPRGFGRKFEEQFAKKFYEASIDKLRAAAHRWAAKYPEKLLIISGDVAVRDARAEYEAAAAMVPGKTFVHVVNEMPGFREWLDNEGRDVTMWQAAKVVDAYLQHPPRARSDGQPFNGWRAFVTDALRDERDRNLPGAVDEAAALETSQLPKTTQRRLRTASKKR